MSLSRTCFSTQKNPETFSIQGMGSRKNVSSEEKCFQSLSFHIMGRNIGLLGYNWPMYVVKKFSFNVINTSTLLG